MISRYASIHSSSCMGWEKAIASLSDCQLIFLLSDTAIILILLITQVSITNLITGDH